MPQVAVNHNQLRTMASETVDPIDWLHPPPYTGQGPLSSTYCTLQCGLGCKSQDLLHWASHERGTFGIPDQRTACAATQDTTTTWKALQSEVVCNRTVNSFKNSFDKYWAENPQMSEWTYSNHRCRVQFKCVQTVVGQRSAWNGPNGPSYYYY